MRFDASSFLLIKDSLPPARMSPCPLSPDSSFDSGNYKP